MNRVEASTLAVVDPTISEPHQTSVPLPLSEIYDLTRIAYLLNKLCTSFFNTAYNSLENFGYS